MNQSTILLINGAFGVGKTTVSRLLQRRIAGSCRFDPERIGYVLRRLPAGLPGSAAGLDDYQQSRFWRVFTATAAVNAIEAILMR